MQSLLRIPLNATPEQFERLRALQVAFADACNAIAPVVQSTRCWNRVALHHLVYRVMRERFPDLGSQMICNAVYSVSRTARLVLQHPKSPWNVSKRSDKPLPLLRFTPSAPVFFDRHTLSLKDDVLSMFTLDGRVRFDVRLGPADTARFQQEKLLEVVLMTASGGFELIFRFADPDAAREIQGMPNTGALPEYVLIVPPEPSPSPLSGEHPPSPDAPSPLAAS